MKIDIHKKDLWWLREALNKSIDYMESQPNPSAFARTPEVARKVNRKVTRAIKKAFGHKMDIGDHQKRYE